VCIYIYTYIIIIEMSHEYWYYARTSLGSTPAAPEKLGGLAALGRWWRRAWIIDGWQPWPVLVSIIVYPYLFKLQVVQRLCTRISCVLYYILVLFGNLMVPQKLANYRRWTNYSNPCNPITPRTPNYNVVFSWFGSPLRMDKINQTLRSGTKIRNYNVEIWGDRG